MKWVSSSPPISVPPRKTSLCPASTSDMYSKARRLGKRRWGCRNPTLLHTLLMMSWVAWTRQTRHVLMIHVLVARHTWSRPWQVRPGGAGESWRVGRKAVSQGGRRWGPLSPYSEGVAFHFLLLPSSSSLVLYQRLFLILFLLWYSLPVIYFPTSRACVPVCLFVWLFCRSVRIYAFMTERNF